MATAQLTDGRVEALRARKTVRDIRDASLNGFGIRVYPAGRKCYFIHTQHEGRRTFKIIGNAADTRLNEARERARSMLAETRTGKTVTTEEILFETVAEEVFLRYGRNWKPGTLLVNRNYYRNEILPWFRGRQITDITPADVQEWFASLHATPVAADRSAPVLSVIMTCAEAYGYRSEGSNPCKGIKRYRRKGRERFLSEQEVHRLGRVLKQHEEAFPLHVAIIRLLLLTGCRGQEIVTLRWVEYRERHLHLTDSKTGPRMVWLSSPARRILDRLPKTAPRVFPSRRTGKSVGMSTTGQFWRRICSKTDLRDVRLHDLRHSFASHAVMQGTPLPVVARLLGHSQTTMTLRCDRETETAAERIGEVISAMLDTHHPEGKTL